MTFFDYLKNIFIILLVLQFTPPLIRGIKKQWGALIEPKSKVAVIAIKGLVYQADPYQKQLLHYFKDPAIKGIVLKMETPGGASGTAQALYQEIVTLKQEYPKPIVTLVENMCTSAGYYIASATDYIVAPGSALIGSIGTSMPYIFKIKGFLEQYKIYNESIKAGAYKDATNPFVAMTPENQAMLQGVLDSAYQQFTQDVAKSRKLSLDHVSEWADGKLFTADQALRHGLVDALGSASVITGIIKERALIEGDIEWVYKKEPTGFARMFGASDDPDDDTTIFMSLAQCDLGRVRALLKMLLSEAFPSVE
ncbi:signal peptide peptidase SppA [Candidatus Dependentiae bacterium]|nr:signal peptide peptidase SppA [Candidatus Dependentiae bacterium]